MNTEQDPTPAASGVEPTQEMIQVGLEAMRTDNVKDSSEQGRVRRIYNAMQSLAEQPAPGVGGWRKVGEPLNGYKGHIATRHINGSFSISHSNQVDPDSTWKDHNGKSQSGVEMSKEAGCEEWLPLEALLATRPAESVAQGGEAWAELIDFAPRAAELAERLVASGPKASHVSCSETHEISEFVLATVAALSRPTPATGSGGEPLAARPGGEEVEEGCTPTDAKVLRKANHALAAENDLYRQALQFYAGREHFNIADADAWDTVSGEPPNFWCDEAGTATVEDGHVARHALTTRPAESVAQCGTCNGHGMIGGHTGQTPEQFDQWEAPCPECNPAAESVAQGGEAGSGFDVTAHQAKCQSRIDAIFNKNPRYQPIGRTETKLPCPKCGCPSELSLDSSSIAEASWIDCGNCEYRFQKACDEETMEEYWNKLPRKKMPVYVEPTPATGSGGEAETIDLIVRDVCETDQANLDDPETIIVNVRTLREIIADRLAHPTPAGGDAGERLCQIYFEIAAEAVGEEVVRAERDRRIAALTAKPGAEGVK